MQLWTWERYFNDNYCISSRFLWHSRENDVVVTLNVQQSAYMYNILTLYSYKFINNNRISGLVTQTINMWYLINLFILPGSIQALSQCKWNSKHILVFRMVKLKVDVKQNQINDMYGWKIISHLKQYADSLQISRRKKRRKSVNLKFLMPILRLNCMIVHDNVCASWICL